MTHALTPQDVWNTLHKSEIFANLAPEEFGQMMSLVQIENIENGTILFNQHGADPNLYIIRRGKAAARKAVPGGVDPIVEFYHPGDLINTFSFLTGRINDVTVEAADDLEVWVIPGNDWRAFKTDFDGIESRIGYPPDARAYIDSRKEFEDQRPGERVLWKSKKHWWVFFGSSTLAWLLFIAVIAVSLLGLSLPVLGVFLDSLPGTILRIGALVAAFLIALWHFIDWRNDYYLVTDQRVIHRERILLMYDQQDECPIGKVQNVNVRRSSWVNSIFDIGDVAVETQGQRANVEFLWVEKPEEAAKAIMGHVNQARVVSHASQKAKIRATIRKEMRLGGEHSARTEQTYVPKRAQNGQAVTFGQKLKVTLRSIRYTLVPPMREQQGNDIVYHKHWLLLLQTAGMPILTLVLYIVTLLVLPILNVELARVVLRSLLVIPVILLGLALIGWLIWNYEDWRNDTYILKPDRVIDSDRSPFGISGTQQKTASMNSIQNVTYNTRGVLDNVFNMGDVSIKTGGQDGELVFERVWNPRRVQRDIVDRLEVLQNYQREAQEEARRREIAEWLGIYDELARLHERKKLG